MTLNLQDSPAVSSQAFRREEVLRQGFSFKPEWWKHRVPHFWPEQLDEVPHDEMRDGYRRITRSDVFYIANSDQSPAGLGRTLLACYVWGTGHWGFLAGRRARTFTSNHAADIERILADAFVTLSRAGSISAFARLARGGDCYIKYLGPSFFTKWLYFVGWDQSPHPSPLILDRFVSIAINEVAASNWRENGPWTPDQYRVYVEAAGDVKGWSPDAVEMKLFDRGRSIYANRKAV